MTAPEMVIVGLVRRAHGIRGELAVESLTDTPDAVFASGRRLFAGTIVGDPSPKGETLTITGARPFKGGWILALEEIADRSAAELWRERYLLLPAEELPARAEGEVYVHELLGMRVENLAGAPLGTVRDVYELPQGLALDVGHEASTSIILPFREEIVKRVDLENRLLVVQPPEGLID
jgi:16S rRNA processing protein RimM